MDAYSKGIIDRNEVLKKTEVWDMEGVLQRTDEITQLRGQIEKSMQEIKKLAQGVRSEVQEIKNNN